MLRSKRVHALPALYLCIGIITAIAGLSRLYGQAAPPPTERRDVAETSISGSASLAATPVSVESRLTAQNALFEEQYQSDLKSNPQLATAYGDYRYNDQLGDYSLAEDARERAVDESFLARLKAIPTTGFSEQDILSHDLLVRILQQRLDDYSLKENEMPVNQMWGVHTGLADLPLSVPFDTVKHYEDYIARLHQIPRVFTQTEEALRAGMKDHLMPVRFLLEQVPAQCDGVIAADPFLIPTRKFPDSISAEDQQRLTKEITDAVNTDVLPAYKSFGAFIATEYAPHGRTTLAVTSLPDGEARYRNDIRKRTTISNLTPDQIHEIGLREMARIEADMLTIAHKEGFSDLASFRASVKANPKYIPTSSDQILDDFRHYIAQMQPKLPELFTYIPGAPVTVEAIPPFQAAMSTHYMIGTPDGKRPGRVVVATSNFAQRSLVDDEATAYHEGIPGHHMQLTVSEHLTALPKFRQFSSNSGYAEGWALYAEQLGKEVGFYQDPISDYGRLTSDLFRAVRLVVDTGIHSQGWTRDQVVEFFRKSGAIDEPTIQSETDRYIAWPAQALSYKLGQLKFLELRDRARKELGPKFDIRTFHDEMLSGGSLPLEMLDARTESWIQAQKLAAKSVAAN
jgi:uncharacterized protein (DUF885 family)